MKKFRINVKRLTMTLGVLGASAGLFAVAAWYKAPLAAFQPQGDPALLGELSPEEAAALGQAAPPPMNVPIPVAENPESGASARDPLDELGGGVGGDDLLGPKAGKHGPTAMALGPVEPGNESNEVSQVEASQAEASQAERPAPMVAEAPAAPAPKAAAAEAGAGVAPKAPAAASTELVSSADRTAPAAETATTVPLVLAAAIDPLPAAAPVRRRSAVGYRVVGRLWHGGGAAIAADPFHARPKAARLAERAPRGAAPGRVAQVGEARYDADRRVLAIPVAGPLSARGLVIRKLGDGRAYVDLPWTRPTFGQGSRSEDVAAGPISRWVMAAHEEPGRAPATRVAFRLNPGAEPRLEVGGGEVRVVLADGGRAAPVAAGAPAPLGAGGARLAEARYDVAAGVLSVPVEGAVDAGALRLKRLDAGRAYLDVAGATPAFSGTRTAVYPGLPLARWSMAGHTAPGGKAITRVAFTLEKPGPVDVRLVGREIRLVLPGGKLTEAAPEAASRAERPAAASARPAAEVRPAVETRPAAAVEAPLSETIRAHGAGEDDLD